MITFRCSVQVYKKIGTVHGFTMGSTDLNDLYEQRDIYLEKRKKKGDAERVIFNTIKVTAESMMENTAKVHKLIEGDYTNAYITHLNKKEKS